MSLNQLIIDFKQSNNSARIHAETTRPKSTHWVMLQYSNINQIGVLIEAMKETKRTYGSNQLEDKLRLKIFEIVSWLN